MYLVVFCVVFDDVIVGSLFSMYCIVLFIVWLILYVKSVIVVIWS